MPRTLLIAALLLPILAIACRGGAGTGGAVGIPVLTATPTPLECDNDSYPADAPQLGNDSAIDYTFTSSGLGIFDHSEGEGETPPSESIVTIHFTAFLPDGCIFETTRIDGRPSSLGLSGLIFGLQEGLTGMKRGGVRRLRIPPDIAYGPRGRPGEVPANSTVIFELVLVDFSLPGADSATSTDQALATENEPDTSTEAVEESE